MSVVCCETVVLLGSETSVGEVSCQIYMAVSLVNLVFTDSLLPCVPYKINQSNEIMTLFVKRNL